MSGSSRYAALDVGSNSVLLTLVQQDADGQLQVVGEQGEVTRLGQDLAQRGQLAPAAVERTLAVIEQLVRWARAEGAEAVAAVGTMALREAVNAQQLVTAVRERCGVTIQVISGTEEARLSFHAARAGLGAPHGPLVVCDVGGGSTELIASTPDGRGMQWRRSVPLGALRLTEAHGSHRALGPAELRALGRAADRLLEPALVGLAPEPARQLVGLGGAITTLTAVALGLEPYDGERVHGQQLSRQEVRRQIARYSALDAQGRQQIPGLDAARAGPILAGAVIVDALLRRLRAEALTVSDRGLRHGLAWERFAAR